MNDAYAVAVDKLARLTFAWGRSGADCDYSRGDVREILDALRADPALAAVALAGEVLPLPTTPGDRFWGKIRGDREQYWFVQIPQVPADSTVIRYTSAYSGSLRAADVEAAGLVCLPDPEVAP